MAPRDAVQAPDLPRLEIAQLPLAQEVEDLELYGALIERDPGEALRTRRVRIRESELRGVVLDARDAPGLELIDVVLGDCGLSNVDGREGQIRRVEVARSRLVGFGLSEGKAQDLRVVDSSMELASFASAGLQNVVFERVNLTDASFMEARLEGVEFIDCRLTGTDFRGAKLTRCAIRGSSLEEVLGVDSLRGVRMPWADIVGSVGALAAALGIAVETET
jgi:uncharacterized protein YjbI with pentapeptide repeats